MKIVLAPDSFKNSLHAVGVCAIMRQSLLDFNSKLEVLSFPMSDGGEGVLAVLETYRALERITVPTQDPLTRPTSAEYLWDAPSLSAYLEMAQAAGLEKLRPGEQNVMKTSSIGVAALLRDAISRGAVNILLFVGGSATCDAGMGMLQGLGLRFLDSHGEELDGNGGNLQLIGKIEGEILLPDDVRLRVMADVDNELFGTSGAAFVYGPQKGASPDQVEQLDRGLRHFAAILKAKADPYKPGMGAAGGIPFGAAAFLGASTEPAFPFVVEFSGMSEVLSGTDMIITGEGKLDAQSGMGKVVGELAALGAERDIPVVALCGQVDLNADEVRALGLREAVSIHPHPDTSSNMFKQTPARLSATLKSMMRRRDL